VPASVVTAVESEGSLVVQTARRVLQPSAFAPSVIAHVLGNGELHRTAEAIRAWWTSQLRTVPPADEEQEARSYRPLIMDGVGCLLAAQVACVVGLLTLR
jgi:hypothetical protein